MDRKSILEKLTLIFRDTFNNSKLILNEELTANDVENWGSLTHMLMITKVEEQFNIIFRLKDLNKMKKVGDLIDVIISKSG